MTLLRLVELKVKVKARCLWSFSSNCIILKLIYVFALVSPDSRGKLFEEKFLVLLPTKSDQRKLLRWLSKLNFSLKTWNE